MEQDEGQLGITPEVTEGRILRARLVKRPEGMKWPPSPAGFGDFMLSFECEAKEVKGG